MGNTCPRSEKGRSVVTMTAARAARAAITWSRRSACGTQPSSARPLSSSHSQRPNARRRTVTALGQRRCVRDRHNRARAGTRRHPLSTRRASPRLARRAHLHHDGGRAPPREPDAVPPSEDAPAPLRSAGRCRRSGAWRCAWRSGACKLLTSSPGRCRNALIKPQAEKPTSGTNRNCEASRTAVSSRSTPAGSATGPIRSPETDARSDR